MNILPSLQYWIFTIFMQFVPLNETEPGNTYVYEIPDWAFRMSIVVEEVSFNNPDSLCWRFSSYSNESDGVTNLRAELMHTPENKLHFSSFMNDGREVLNEGSVKAIPGKDKLLITAEKDDEALSLEAEPEEAEIILSSDTFQCRKSTYKSEGFTIELYHDEMFGLLKGVFKFDFQESDIVFVRVKNGE